MMSNDELVDKCFGNPGNGRMLYMLRDEVLRMIGEGSISRDRGTTILRRTEEQIVSLEFEEHADALSWIVGSGSPR